MKHRLKTDLLFQISEPGISIAEYTLCVCLVLLLGIPALSELGRVLNDIFRNMLPSNMSASAELASVPKAPLKPTNPVPNNIQPTEDLAAKDTVKISFSVNGAIISLPDYPNNIQNTVQTVGANGTTELLSSQLKLLTKQLFEAGEISSTEANDLYTLANRGHNLAAFEKQVETTFESQESLGAMDKKTFTTHTIDVAIASADDADNHTKTTTGIWRIIGQMDVQDGKASSNLGDFKNAWDKAKDSPIMTNPSISAIVNQLASSIYNISASLSDASEQFLKQKLPNAEAVTANVASRQTNNTSANICHIGNGEDAGIHCG